MKVKAKYISNRATENVLSSHCHTTLHTNAARLPKPREIAISSNIDIQVRLLRSQNNQQVLSLNSKRSYESHKINAVQSQLLDWGLLLYKEGIGLFLLFLVGRLKPIFYVYSQNLQNAFELNLPTYLDTSCSQLLIS